VRPPSAPLERLGSHGFHQHTIGLEVSAQGEVSSFFEGLLNAAQARRLLLLKEIKSLLVRKAACRARQSDALKQLIPSPARLDRSATAAARVADPCLAAAERLAQVCGSWRQLAWVTALASWGVGSARQRWR
jgi:hypothetical protein